MLCFCCPACTAWGFSAANWSKVQHAPPARLDPCLCPCAETMLACTFQTIVATIQPMFLPCSCLQPVAYFACSFQRHCSDGYLSCVGAAPRSLCGGCFMMPLQTQLGRVHAGSYPDATKQPPSSVITPSMLTHLAEAHSLII